MPTNPASYNLNFIARNALNRYGFLSEMSQRAVNEAKAMHPDFWPHLEPGVKDLTELLWSSIDNDDSRDLDQVGNRREAAGRRAGGQHAGNGARFGFECG